ncbi:McrB family protein [Veillonella sp.]|uniref:McrB family protein n=1 Tax=Veillonella sp. TaxID=1926307 RepID=UPI00290CF886|nr:AAA family ATPase [Veillonella sp.]MDU3475133.1 AAA family ATPase [Veillonella sp.]MDU3481572.1 AAA family ATPase [Veillonella sp.]
MNSSGKQEKFILTITADSVVSTDECFDINNLSLGDNYKPLDVKFQKMNGDIITRKYNKGERKNSNQTMPRLALQIFEKQIVKLSLEEKETFPICKYNPDGELRYGIYPSVEAFKKYRNTIEYLKYFYDEDRIMVIYCWNLFSTIIFVQECLKRFGEPGDKFLLTYREKDIKENEDETIEATIQEELGKPIKEYGNEYSRMLIESKNIIFRGAPGTGKSYLAKQIATDIISEGYFDKYESLNDEQKKQVEFVQFHPSYDYSDFVEGLRPKINDDGTMGFELKDGIFKRFVSRARRNYENSQKPKELVEKESSVQESMKNFFDNIELGVDEFKTLTGNSFYISSVDDSFIHITIPGNDVVNKLVLSVNEIKQMLESGLTFTRVKDITNFFNKQFASQAYSYEFVILKAIQSSKIRTRQSLIETEPLKKYIFIIDEINRGEISKIFGELFYSIDPGYRGKSGEISTQYSNLQMCDEKFYIPENLYIIGTMNDIDRSVDSFDFAMRRRFRFIEIKADATTGMLDGLRSNRLDDAANELLPEKAINRMTALNEAILEVKDLNENYQIGASYFLKLKNLTFDELWTDCLRPLLQEYVQGLYDEEGIMKKFATAYGYIES